MLRYCCQNLSQSVCKNKRNLFIGVPNKVSGAGLCDVVKGVIECIWLNLRYGLERTSATNGLESGCITQIVQNLERYFPYW